MTLQSTAKRPVFSAYSALCIVGDALSRIKKDDGLTWADVGAVLGKSEDQAAKYAAGEADMGLVSFARGMREWNGRLSGELLQLCKDSRPGAASDRIDATRVLQAATALSEALQTGDEITIEAIRKNRAALERARDAIDAQLGKLRPEAAA
ncbi:hypothetical protein FHW96_000271 [Novosphingobium sp. SG751A]|uniref:hypothetical protein n=1 Tax=Novosphingobium sp. SG751A TaxID=2587000 RepID=UPI001555CF49|nr:hypothetical protein [Novosphingobium sp. SG751A]NOW44144.1 hypothetical protein [Novosphingobium sp. SG751A]